MSFVSQGRVPPGTRLNGIYAVETLLADGGMGEVYKGHNIQTGDPVAIKLMLPEMSANPDALALFRREASTLHNLWHEAIVRYFVFSVDPDLGRAYLAMEFVDGPSLSTRLLQGPLDLAEVRILQRRLADGLEAAHRFGVVHRDISPDNIILPGGDVRRAKIIDFGIAKSQRPNEGTIIGGGFAGKYKYASPEQLGLAGGVVTAKSDIYSLGLVLAESLRGKPIDMGGSQLDVIEKRRNVPDLSDIHPQMQPLIAAMLQPLPADRPAGMADVAGWGAATQSLPGPTGAAAGTGPIDPRTIGHADPGRARRALLFVAVLVIASITAAGFYLFRNEPFLAAMLPGGEEDTAAKPPSLPPLPQPSGPTSARIEAPEPKPGPATPPKSETADAAASTAEPKPLPALPPPQDIQNGQPPAMPGAEAAASARQPAAPDEGKHVPTADEILTSIQSMKEQKTATADSAPEPGMPNVPPQTSQEAVAATANPPSNPDAPPAAPPAENAAANAAPVAPQAALTLADASQGHSYIAALPPFNDANDPRTLKLRVEPPLPGGLSFADHGSGFGVISGTPAAAGRFRFDVIATDKQGATAHMATELAVLSPTPVAPPAPTLPVTPPAPTSPVAQHDKIADFVRRFEGGECFYARPVALTDDSAVIEGFGNKVDGFNKLEADFRRSVGFEPQINLRQVADAQCAALTTVGRLSADRRNAPTVVLTGFDVGPGRPLTGTVEGIGDRNLALLLVSNDGQLIDLHAGIRRAGQGASFDIALMADARSAGAPQLLLAVTSSKPLAALADVGSGKAATILPKLAAEIQADSGAGIELKFFKLAK